MSVLGVTAIIGLVALEITALVLGKDGAYFLPVVAIIGGIAGYSMREVKETISSFWDTRRH